MIVLSLLLILVAVALLVLGLTAGSSTLLIGSIVTSLLAAISLVIGARRTAAARRAVLSDHRTAESVAEPAMATARRAARDSRAEEPAEEPAEEAVLEDSAPEVPAQSAGGTVAADAEADPEDPADEPLPQAVRPVDAVRVAQLPDEVVVVDGRPRYHLADCPTLADRSFEPLPVAEAIELGFSPCGRCRPVDRLVAAAVRP